MQLVNWALLTTAFARIGFITAALANFGLSGPVGDGALVARKLIALAKQDPSGKETLDTAEQLKKVSQQIVLILEDALAYRPDGTVL